jgi:site-specific DNA recombinase
MVEQGAALSNWPATPRLFGQQVAREKRRLANFVLSNCTWENGEVVATFREAFDMLAETATNLARLGNVRR